MSYTDLLCSESVILDLKAQDFDEVLAILADGLVRVSPELKDRRDEMLDALKAREALGSTASQGVAIPHVKMKGVQKVSIVVAVHREGVDFRALDGEPVHVFFSVIRPEETADEHLGILRWIADIAQHQDFVSFSCQASTPEQILDLLVELSPA
ncbi:MAG: PTS sugar transporter subunit IIA [Planctomycetota bacterium]|nr:MAG: PTS sugar transporter subunit IIA [Planctomycetota bacterium]